MLQKENNLIEDFKEEIVNKKEKKEENSLY